jgi:hypothetical protein
MKTSMSVLVGLEHNLLNWAYLQKRKCFHQKLQNKFVPFFSLKLNDFFLGNGEGIIRLRHIS